MSIDFPDEYLAKMWDEMDWAAAEKKLADLQERLSIAVYRKNDKEIEDLQKRIVRDSEIKCLAVRHVCSSTMSPGVDKVKWKTSAEKNESSYVSDLKGLSCFSVEADFNNGKEHGQGAKTETSNIL